MQTPLRPPRSSLIFVGLLFGLLFVGACSPSPINDPLGWNGRGMSLPIETGAAGSPAGGSGGAGTGAAGTGLGGSAGITSSQGADTGDGRAGTGSPIGAGDSGGMTTIGGASGSGSAGSAGGGGSAAPPTDAGLPPAVGTGPPVSPTCQVAVSATTHSGGGNHSPKNVDAIWVEDASGKFVKSLYVMARNEIQHLNAWNAATTAAGLSRNRVDAVTGASLPGYGTRMASWNCTDVNGKPVALGGYQICFDLNDGNGSDKSTCDNFTLGKAAATVMPPDVLPCFTGRILTYTP